MKWLKSYLGHITFNSMWSNPWVSGQWETFFVTSDLRPLFLLEKNAVWRFLSLLLLAIIYILEHLMSRKFQNLKVALLENIVHLPQVLIFPYAFILRIWRGENQINSGRIPSDLLLYVLLNSQSTIHFFKRFIWPIVEVLHANKKKYSYRSYKDLPEHTLSPPCGEFCFWWNNEKKATSVA